MKMKGKKSDFNEMLRALVEFLWSNGKKQVASGEKNLLLLSNVNMIGLLQMLNGAPKHFMVQIFLFFFAFFSLWFSFKWKKNKFILFRWSFDLKDTSHCKKYNSKKMKKIQSLSWETFAKKNR